MPGAERDGRPTSLNLAPLFGRNFPLCSPGGATCAGSGQTDSPAADRRARFELTGLAPSVGNCQPARFVSVETPERRAKVIENFEAANREALGAYAGERARSMLGSSLRGSERRRRIWRCSATRRPSSATASARARCRRRAAIPRSARSTRSGWRRARTASGSAGYRSSSLKKSPPRSIRPRTGVLSAISASAGRKRRTRFRSWSAPAGRARVAPTLIVR